MDYPEAFLLVSGLSMLAVMVIGVIGLQPVHAQPTEPLRTYDGVGILTALVLVAILRLPCSAWNLLAGHRLEFVLGGGMLVMGGIASVILHRRRPRRVSLIIGICLIVAGAIASAAPWVASVSCTGARESPGKPSARPWQREIDAAARALAVPIVATFVAYDSGIRVLGARVLPIDDGAKASAAVVRAVGKLGSSVNMASVAVCGILVGLFVWPAVSGFNRWASRAGWRQWLRPFLLVVAGSGMVPPLTGLIGAWASSLFLPERLFEAWIAGLLIGLAMILWLVIWPGASHVPAKLDETLA